MNEDNADQANSLSRPASPESEGAVGGVSAKSPHLDEVSIPPKELPDRRKSMSWKTFNFKRQLSKVNMKIGLNMSGDSDSAPKGTSVFYTQKEECSPEECDISPSKDPVVTMGVECRESMTDTSLGDTMDALCDSIFASELQDSARDTQQSTGGKRVDFANDVDVCTQSMRPNNLPITSVGEVPPARPPRQKIKEKRDQRLLSVPNIKYQMRDTRSRTVRNDSSPSVGGNVTKKAQKVDGSFTRSRSSSISSIDMSSAESVTCLALIESYSKRNDTLSIVPTLWVGTSFGSILTLVVAVPEREMRKSQPVLVTINGGPILRLKGSITSMSFLDAFGAIIPISSEPWRDDSRDTKKERTPTKSSSRTSPTFTPTTANSISNTSGGNVSTSVSSSGISGSVSTGLDTIADRQYIVIASEKQTKVFDIANQCCVNRIQLSEMEFAVKAKTITLKDGSCLATYLSNGHLMVHSLPSLKPIMDTEFLPLMDLSFQTKCKQGIVDPMLSIWGQQIIVHEDITQISKIFCFSNRGHGLYMASPTEIQKFTISSEFCQFILDMMGSLFTVQEMPEQPKESFFKGLFGGGAKNLDREELFGEQSGKANRSIAKHIPGPTLEQLNQRASTAASEISRAHLLAMERGEKLNLLEERAERMANQAQDFSGSAHQLMLKYKDKKWYQL